MKLDFPGHPLVWDALARRPWVDVDTTALKGMGEIFFVSCELVCKLFRL